MSASRSFVVILLVLVAALVQAIAGDSLSVFNARPDLPLLVVICVGVLTDFHAGSCLGFWNGILLAALAGANFGSLLFSRTITGAFCGWLSDHLSVDSPIAAPFAVGSATLLCRFLYFLMAPTHQVFWYLKQTTGEFCYHIILAYPVYFALRAAGFGTRTNEGFSALRG
jgi:rod shape-determining protein MreD